MFDFMLVESWNWMQISFIILIIATIKQVESSVQKKIDLLAFIELVAMVQIRTDPKDYQKAFTTITHL